MITYMTPLHYLVLAIILLLFIASAIAAMRQERGSVRLSLIATSLVVMVMLTGFLFMALDKYTKIAEIRNLKNTRVLMNEEIIYSGLAYNAGKYTIKKVELEIKLVNRGHVTGNVKGGNFYRPSGFWDFFGKGEAAVRKERPQTIIRTFVVATNLAPGKSHSFSVRMPYPPYFEHTADYTRVFAH